jgi:glutamate mutase epsilon subunit
VRASNSKKKKLIKPNLQALYQLSPQKIFPLERGTICQRRFRINRTVAKVSRAELIQIMEGFVELVKNSDEADGSNQLSFAPPQIEVRDVVSAADQAAEIAELKTLLVEAQGTIIRLLTDRVDDRARLATLQNEIKLLPDLKAQSERAAAIAFTAEEFKAEFAKVKLEIERMKLTKMRSEVDNASRPWWAKFFAWMKKKDSAQD